MKALSNGNLFKTATTNKATISGLTQRGHHCRSPPGGDHHVLTSPSLLLISSASFSLVGRIFMFWVCLLTSPSLLHQFSSSRWFYLQPPASCSSSHWLPPLPKHVVDELGHGLGATVASFVGPLLQLLHHLADELGEEDGDVLVALGCRHLLEVAAVLLSQAAAFLFTDLPGVAQVLFVPHQAHGNIGLPKRQVASVSFPGLFFLLHCIFLHFKRPLLKLKNIPFVADVDPEIILASSSVWKPRKAREKYLPKPSRLSAPFPVPLGGNGRRKAAGRMEEEAAAHPLQCSRRASRICRRRFLALMKDARSLML